MTLKLGSGLVDPSWRPGRDSLELHVTTADGAMEAETSPHAANQSASPQEVRRATTRLKVREHRQKLRAQGMRPIQIWVPDVRSPEFAVEARRQSLLVAQSPEEAEIQALIDSVLEWPNDEYSV